MISAAIDPKAIDNVWDKLFPMIERGLRHGAGDGYTSDDVYAALKNKTMTMLVVHEDDNIIACAIVSVAQYPSKKTLFIELLAGRDMDSWLPEGEVVLKKYRDSIGADTIEASCRFGLAKRLTRWKPKATLMELI